MRIDGNVVVTLILIVCVAGCGGLDETGDQERFRGAGSGMGSARAAAFSPGGTRVAYVWRDPMSSNGIYIQRLDGSHSYVLYPGDYEIVPLDWSIRDMRVLTLIRRPGRSDEVVLVSIDGLLGLIGGAAVVGDLHRATDSTGQNRRAR